jgi:hypothetical protein
LLELVLYLRRHRLQITSVESTTSERQLRAVAVVL